MLILCKRKRMQAPTAATRDVPHPDGAGARHVPRPRHQGRHNAGGLDPAAAPTAVRDIADRLGLDRQRRPRRGRRPAADRLDGLRRASARPTSTPASRSTADVPSPPTPTSAAGASPTRSPRAPTSWSPARVTDAARRRRPGGVAVRLVARPTGTRLAGAVAAGHVIECGAQATGGNYAFFDEVAGPASRSASRSPRSPRRLVRDHQAPRHRRRGHGRHRHRPAALRDRRPGLPQPRRRRPLRHDPARRRSAGPGAHQRRARRAARRRR